MRCMLLYICIYLWQDQLQEEERLKEDERKREEKKAQLRAEVKRKKKEEKRLQREAERRKLVLSLFAQGAYACVAACVMSFTEKGCGKR